MESSHGATYEMTSMRENHVSSRLSSQVTVGRTQLVQELPPVDGGKKAWIFCASSFVLELMVWGFSFSYGIFQNFYTSHPPFQDDSFVAISAVGTTCIALQYATAIFLSFAVVRFPDYVKTSMWCGLGLSAGSLLLSSFATKVWHLILLQGICVGLGGGLLYFPVVLMLSQWFVQRRGLAVGLVFSGSGAGGFLFPLILNALLERVGFRWTLRIWALALCTIAGIALLGVNPRLPIPKFSREQRRPRFIPPHMQFVRNPLFWCFIVISILQGMSYFPVSLYIAPFATAVSSPLSATIVLSLFNSSGVVGQILIGHLSDRFPYAWIMFASALGSGVAAFLLWGFADSLARIFAFSIVFGSLVRGVILACAFLFKGASAVVGPVIAGVLNPGHFGSFGFEAVELFVGACAVATSLSSILVPAARRRMRA
ncbi:MFS general substrate transporter [Amylocystis lapponica]|nr:MFS general substrate transporter [Amylocystis lapponica]